MATMATTLRHQHHLFHKEYVPTPLAMSEKKPNKDTPPAFFKGDFSFVNKDANNIDSKDHNAAVSWHVMNRYERFKKQEQARKLRASANIPTSSRSSNARRRRQPLSPGDQSGTETPLDFGLEATTVSPFGSISQGGVADLPSRSTSLSYWPTSNMSSPSSQSPSLLASPDLSGVSTSIGATQHEIPESADVSSVLSFAYETYLPNLWPTEPGNVQSSHEMSRSWEDIATISSDDCYDAAYLALLLTVMSEVESSDNRLRYQSRLYQSQAMGQLRQRLSGRGSQDLLTMKAILALFSSETVTDSTATARVHLKSLRNLVMANGGVILLDSWFREDLLSADCYFAMKYSTRPLFPAADWTPGPLSQPWKARFVSAGIFGDHAASVDKRVEHPVLKTAVVDLRELFRAQEYILTHEVPAEDQLLRWRQLRRFDCVSRLADHCTNLAIYGHLYELPKTQMVVTLALVLVVNMVMGCPEPVRFGGSLVERLRVAVGEYEVEEKVQEKEKTKRRRKSHRRGGEEADEDDDDDDDDDNEGNDEDDDKLLLWALYIGSLAERVHTPSQQQQQLRSEQSQPDNTNKNEEWFNTRMKQALQRQNLRRRSGDWWEEMKKKILRHYLFSMRLHEEIIGGSRRACRTRDFCPGLYTACGMSWRRPIFGASGGGGGEELIMDDDGGQGSSSGVTTSR